MSAAITKEKPKILESAITVLHLFHFEKPGGWEGAGNTHRVSFLVAIKCINIF